MPWNGTPNNPGMATNNDAGTPLGGKQSGKHPGQRLAVRETMRLRGRAGYDRHGFMWGIP